MDSTTSHHHESSDDERDELDRINARDVIEQLDHLAGAIGDERAAGSALFLSAHPKPSRAFLGNPPRLAQKKGETGRSDPDKDEKR